jgi:sugar transferase EpsL
MGYRGKRLFDLVLVVGAMPIWLPVLGALSLIVRRKLGTPVLFRQQRPGQDARPFTLLKFRTMTDERDASGSPLADADRLTPFGRWLRSTSLDELPELINVIKGDMSLVGPRPLLLRYVPRYSPRHGRRHEVQPGITGLAQVSGRNALSWADRFELDVHYVDHCSLSMDAQILLRTIRPVFFRSGIAARGEATMSEFTGYDA